MSRLITQLMISFPFNYWGLMMVAAMALHTLGFLLSLNVFMYFYILCTGVRVHMSGYFVFYLNARLISLQGQ